MRALSIALLGLLYSCCLSGCSFTDSSQEKTETSQRMHGSVAVVDLDEVAKRVSRDTELAAAVKIKEIDLNEKLTLLKDSYGKQLEKEKELYGSKPKKEQTDKIAALDRQLGSQLRDAQRRAQNEMDLFRKSFIDRFRQQVKPLARDIAAQRGLTVVITASQPFFLSVDPKADITDEVVEKILAMASEKSSKTNFFPKVSNLPQRDGEFTPKR